MKSVLFANSDSLYFNDDFKSSYIKVIQRIGELETLLEDGND